MSETRLRSRPSKIFSRLRLLILGQRLRTSSLTTEASEKFSALSGIDYCNFQQNASRKREFISVLRSILLAKFNFKPSAHSV